MGIGGVDAEIHQDDVIGELIVVLLEPETPNVQELLAHGIPPPHFRVNREDLARICRQILREIDPTPEDRILQQLEEIRSALEK